MLAKLIIFVVDLTLVLAIFAILYAVYLIATAGIFILAVFYIVKRMNKSCDSSKDIWVLDSSTATGKPFASNTGGVRSRMLPVHLPAARGEAFLPEKCGSVF
uniref:Uncharacterized protein n=1 Tax=Panthera leo TaxID=9689 RepID=A0A8C8WID0_PANLE